MAISIKEKKERRRLKQNTAAKNRRAKNPEKFRKIISEYRNKIGIEGRRKQFMRYNLKRFGLTLEQYEAMVEAQGGKCAICEKPEKTKHRWKCNDKESKARRLCVDHDHKTGEVRGLLCSECNSGIGKLGDNIDGLRKALSYLESNCGN